MSRASFGCVPFVVLMLAAAGCGGSDPVASTTPTPDGGKVIPGSGDSTRVTQTGTIVDLDTKKGVAGATVTIGDQTATTGSDGSYAITVKKGEPFSMSVTAPDYASLHEQETVLDADFDRGPTSFVSSFTASLLLGALPGYDPAFGVLSVELNPTGACATEEGARVTVSPAGSAQVRYVVGSFPSATRDSVAADSFPSAIIYNVEPGVPLTVTVEGGSCTQTPFPVDKDGVRYTGNVVTAPGNATSFERIYLQ